MKDGEYVCYKCNGTGNINEAVNVKCWLLEDTSDWMEHDFEEPPGIYNL